MRDEELEVYQAIGGFLLLDNFLDTDDGRPTCCGVSVIESARRMNGERTGGSEERRRRGQSDRKQETILLRSMEREGSSELGGSESRRHYRVSMETKWVSGIYRNVL